MDKDDIVIKREFVNKLKAYIAEIEYLCDDDNLTKKIQDLQDYVNSSFKDSSSEKELLEEVIYTKMKDSKKFDRDLYAKYYMLYQDVKNNRIDIERAKELCESFERFAHYEKRIF
ncbi:hypothetical protein [Clostridium oryzae]|uniref:Uncharacterized protein n=1 Tax=Clostridium oryzae TaxID=1450648 RepID=A0A1V4ICS5_9CLOT|nr:hypothetical protein [Clostridium oryzae]OPJ57808.1 hypothetical protein CLORY_39280 [Clostridium oryzae]